MPIITCPYCKVISESKFLHKTHLRNEHPALFANNIRTTITGSEIECSRHVENVVLSLDNVSSVTDGVVNINFTHGFYDFKLSILADLLWSKLVDSMLGIIDSASYTGAIVDGSDVYFDAKDEVDIEEVNVIGSSG